MTVLRYFFRRLRALWRSDEIHDEIAEEMRFHIELRAEENVRRGMTPEEATLLPQSPVFGTAVPKSEALGSISRWLTGSLRTHVCAEGAYAPPAVRESYFAK